MDVDTAPESRLRLSEDRPVVVGRAEGYRVPYLNPRYRATTKMPGTGNSILHSQGHGNDICVSRGHFMLRSSPGGIAFVNGVPKVGGGIRPPVNGTRLLEPTQRELQPGEEYLIDHGQAIRLELPNGTVIQIKAA